MKLKNKLLELNKTYEEMMQEALNVLEIIKPKIKNITDLMTVDRIIKNKSFYWKHDLKTIRELSKEYNIKISKLEDLCKKYIEIEEILLKTKNKFEKLGLTEISFGPKTLISACGKEDSNVLIYPGGDKLSLDITISHKIDFEGIETKDFKKFSKEIKKKIQDLIEEEIN